MADPIAAPRWAAITNVDFGTLRYEIAAEVKPGRAAARAGGRVV